MSDYLAQIFFFLLGIALTFGSQLVGRTLAKYLTLFFGILSLLVVAYWSGYLRGQKASNLLMANTCDQYGIKIISPQDGTSVTSDFQIIGTYDKLPPEGRLLIYLSLTDQPGYWPESIVQFNKSDNTWVGNGKFVGTSPSEGFFHVLFVGNSGRALYDYVLKAGIQSGSSFDWVPIDQFTDDTDVCGKILVKYVP